MEVGGNQLWWDFILEYKFQAEVLNLKYKRAESAWYKRRLAKTAMGQTFTEKAPAKSYLEAADRVTSNLGDAADKAGRQASEYVGKLFK